MPWLPFFPHCCACRQGQRSSECEAETDLHYASDEGLSIAGRQPQAGAKLWHDLGDIPTRARISSCPISDGSRSRGSTLEEATTSYEESEVQLDLDPDWHVRGVRIDENYDFYDVSERRFDVRKMSEDWAGRSTWRAFASDSTSSPRSCESSCFPSDSTAASPRCDIARKPRSELEIITNWGVLAGVLLHSRVAGFGDIVLQLQRHHKRANVKGYRLMHSVQRRAQAALDAAFEVAKRVDRDADCCDSEWSEDNLLVTLFGIEYIDTLLILANSVRKIISTQPMLAKAEAPSRIFGDLHGQFRDLLLFFHTYGFPDRESGPTMIFNGDFVDRGSHQLEVIGILFALKLLMPDKVWLVRGNHEDRLMNEKYGFQTDCRSRLGKEFGFKVYDHFHKAFDQLPVACVVANKVLVVHGGLGDGRWTLNDVEAIERPLNGDALYSSPVFNMLWSDPMDDEEESGASSKASTFGVHASPRRRDVVKFGWNVTKMFCARNGIGLIVRSHECKLGGMGFDVMHESRLIRVFSARDYEDNGNSAAVLMVTSTDSTRRFEADESASFSSLLTVRPQVIHSATQGCIHGKADEAKKISRASSNANNKDDETKKLPRAASKDSQSTKKQTASLGRKNPKSTSKMSLGTS